MPRHQTWIFAIVAPVLICLALLFTCQYVSADVSNSIIAPQKNLAPSDPIGVAVNIHASSSITTPFDALLQQSVYSSDNVYPGSRVVYTLRISHTNVSSMSGLVLTSTVSPEFIPTDSYNVGATITPISTYPTYTWRIDNLQPGKQAAIYIVGNIDPAQSSPGVLTNVATLSKDLDSDPTNNSITLSLPVEVPRINLSSSTIDVQEGAPSVAIDIGLDSPNPYESAQVDYMAVSLNNGTDATSAQDYVPISGTITIPAANSSQRFFVDIIDDAIDEDLENIAIKLTNPRGIDLGTSDAVTITIIDNDDAGVLTDPLQVNVPEDGQTEKYMLTLTSQPEADVYITLGESDDLVVDNSVITFTAANWNIPQSITVGAAVNDIDDGDRRIAIGHQVNSQDPFYHNRTVNEVAVNISDDDSTGIIISSAEITIFEGDDRANNNDAAYTIVLNSMPTAAVSIAVNPGSDQLKADKESVTFTPQNWSDPQTITIFATDDAIAEGIHTGTIAHRVNSADTNYASAEANGVSISIEDDDVSGVIFSTDMVMATESLFTRSYSVTLASQPLSSVLLQTETDNSRLTIEPDTLEFSPETWDIPQQIMVSASTDNGISGTQTINVDHLLQSQDPMYNERTESLAVSVRDVDYAGLIITSSMLTILEGQTPSAQPSITNTNQNQYDIFLTSRPVNTVTVKLSYSEQLTIIPNVLIFEPDDWMKSQSVTVSANNDSIFRGRQAYTVTHQLASSDLNYDALTESLKILVMDDDSPVVGSGEAGLIEGTSSDNYTIALAKKPASPVTITLTTNEQILVEPPAVQFTDADWNTPQTLTVTSTDDEVQDNQIGVIVYKILSTDQSYARSTESKLFEIPIVDNDQNTSVYLPVINVLQ